MYSFSNGQLMLLCRFRVGHGRVQYDGCANRWTFHPAALVKVCTFHVGDLVTIINDVAKVQQLQKGHGEWVETMRNVIMGTPLKMYIVLTFFFLYAGSE